MQAADENTNILVVPSKGDAIERVLSSSLEDDDEENDGMGLVPESLEKTQAKTD
jgi:hypothetical protein